MSVRECPECQGTVADSRSECPHCGKNCPRTAKKRLTVRDVVLFSCYMSVVYTVGSTVGSLLDATVAGYLLGVAAGSGAAICVHPWG